MQGDDGTDRNDEVGKGSGTSRRDLLKTATGVVAATVVGGALLEAGRSAASPSTVAAAAPDAAAFTMMIHGIRQGDFAGDPGQNDNVILGYGFEFEAIAPTDPATGQGSGKPELKPVVVTKEWGASTSQIFEALLTNERLQVTLQFDAAEKDMKGSSFKIVLKDALVADQKLNIAVGDMTRLEQVSFAYREINLNGVIADTGGVFK